MRIHFITEGGLARDGENADLPFLCAIVKRLVVAHEVTVVTLRQYPQPCRYTRLGAQVINVGIAPRGFHRLEPALRRWRLWRALRGTPPPDIVHAFWIGAGSNLAFDHPTAGTAPRVVYNAGGELIALEDIAYGGMRHPGGRSAAARAFREADVLLTGCEEAYLRIPATAKQRKLLPLYPDTTLFRRDAAALAGQSGHVLTVANINRVKDPGTLLRAFAIAAERVPNARLTWCGLDTLNGEAQRLARDLGISERVRFAGLVPYEELPAYYHEAQVYLQSSRHEGQGVAVCEAAAAGLALVGTEVGILRDLATRRCALAVPPQDPQALGETLAHVLTKPDLRAELRRNAATWAATHTVEETVHGLETLYKDLIRKPRA